MKFNEYKQVIKEVFNKHNLPLDENIMTLAITRYAMTPDMKSTYPSLELTRRIDTKSLGLIDSVDKGNTRVRHRGTFDPSNNDFNIKQIDNFMYNHANIVKIKDQSTLDAAARLSDCLKFSTNYKDFIKQADNNDIVKIIPTLYAKDKEFLELVSLMQTNPELHKAPYEYVDFIKIVNLAVDKISTYDDEMTNMLNIANQVDEPSDEYQKKYNLLRNQGIDFDISAFNIASLEHQIKHFDKVIKEGLPPNDLIRVLFEDPANFVDNVFEKIIFEDIKKSLLFNFKLISKEMTVEKLYEQNPLVEEIFNEALKRDPLLNTAKKQDSHTIVFDKNIDVTKSNKILENIDPVGFYDDYSKVFKGTYKMFISSGEFKDIDPNSNNIRFIGEKGLNHDYIFQGCIMDISTEENKVPSKNKKLQMQHLSVGTLSDERFKEAVENLLLFCKNNDYILFFDKESLKGGLSYQQDSLLSDIINDYQGVVMTIFEDIHARKKYKLIEQLDMTVKQLVKLDSFIDDSLYDLGLAKTLALLQEPKTKNSLKLK